jgi:hypothetical protein
VPVHRHAARRQPTAAHRVRAARPAIQRSPLPSFRWQRRQAQACLAWTRPVSPLRAAPVLGRPSRMLICVSQQVPAGAARGVPNRRSVIVRADSNMSACRATRPRERYRSPDRKNSTRPLTSQPVLETSGGAGGTRTHGVLIMRSTAPCTIRASCTDGTDHRTDGTHHARIILRAIPRTIPRLRRPSCYCA